MWQHHYFVHLTRMEQLREDADRARRWRLADEANGRRTPGAPGRARGAVARLVAAGSRAGVRLARRLDERVVIDLGPERLIRDA